MSNADVPALVLAAGAGRRMGGPKALVRVGPERVTLLDRAVGRIRAGGCDDVLVVVGAAVGEVAPLAGALGVEVVTADNWAEGMGASVRAGLAALGRRQPPPAAVLVTLVDLPDVTGEVVSRVLAAARAEPHLREVLLRAAYRGRPGHPVVIGAGHWGRVVGAAHGDVGARAVLASPRTTLVECGDLATGDDVDRPEQLERWRSEHH